MILDTKDYSANQLYHITTQTVIPRPIAWVLTENKDGTTCNLAPFSYFNAICNDPLILLFSVSAKATADTPTDKDTLQNIKRKPAFVIHIAHSNQIDAVEKSAKPLDYGDSEIAYANLSLTSFEGTELKRVSDAPIAFACHLHDIQPIGNQQQQLVFAAVDKIYVQSDYVTVNDKQVRIDANGISPLCRLGGGYYSSINEKQKPLKTDK